MAGALWSLRSWRDSDLAECSQPWAQPSIFPGASNQAPRSSASMQRKGSLNPGHRMESRFPGTHVCALHT